MTNAVNVATVEDRWLSFVLTLKTGDKSDLISP